MSNGDGPAAAPHDAAPGSALLAGMGEGTRLDFERFVDLLTNWQRTHNLVAQSTVADVWNRHIADSLQLLAHAPSDWREWVDLGSGAGFPGLVAAIASKDRPERRVTLVESNGKKAAFLRAAIRETGANANVAAMRIEAHAHDMAGQADVVSARALSPLPALIGLARPYAKKDGVMLFLKGEDAARELEAASQRWRFDVIRSPSATDSRGCVLAIRNVDPKVRP